MRSLFSCVAVINLSMVTLAMNNVAYAQAANPMTFRVEPAVIAAPSKTVTTGPGLSAAHYFNGSSGAFEPVRLRSEFVLRAEPNKETGHKVMSVGDAIVEDAVILTGKTKTTVESNGVSGEWVEVLFRHESAWLSRDAVVGELPFAAASKITAAPANAPSSAAVPANTTAPQVRSPAARVAPSQPVSTGPICVNRLSELRKNPRFQKALGGVNPFTNWMGPMGASISMNGTGAAVLHHPVKGEISLNVTLCLDRKDVPYIGVNGNEIYFDGPGLHQVSVADPGTNERYSFTRMSQ